MSSSKSDDTSPIAGKTNKEEGGAKKQPPMQSSESKSEASLGDDSIGTEDMISEESAREEQELVFTDDEHGVRSPGASASDGKSKKSNSSRSTTPESSPVRFGTPKGLEGKSAKWCSEGSKPKSHEEKGKAAVDLTQPYPLHYKRVFPEMHQSGADDKPKMAPKEETPSLTGNSPTSVKSGGGGGGASPLAGSTPSERNLCCGLSNLGFTCYANAVLQMLYGWSKFRGYILTHGELGLFHRVLSDLFDEMISEATQCRRRGGTALVAPKEFFRHFIEARPEFALGRQQDAQEFLSILLELLHSESNQASKLSTEKLVEQVEPSSAQQAWDFHLAHVENSFLSNCLMGQVQSTLTCLKCGQKSLSWSCIWQLQLQLPANVHKEAASKGEEQPSLKLIDCVADYFAKETLKDDSAPKCTPCGAVPQAATKEQSICRAPSYLLVHLKRYAANRAKDHRLVDIGLELTFGGRHYELLSLVLHDGSEEDGHYGTMRRCKKGPTGWLAFDDGRIFTEPLNEEAARTSIAKYAYLALFVAID